MKFARWIKRWIVALCLAAGLIVVLGRWILGSVPTAASSKPVPNASKIITIGTDLPLNGGEAAGGETALHGVELAVAEANASAPLGFTFRIESRDDAVNGIHDPDRGAQNVRTFVDTPSVLGVIGPYNSNVAQAEIPILRASNLVEISPSATNPALTRAPFFTQDSTDPTTFFRVAATDDLQGAAGAKFARLLGYRTAFVVDDGETYGRDLTTRFERSFRADGGVILGRWHAVVGQHDFRFLLRRIAAHRPDLVYFGGVTENGAAAMRRQLAESGLGSAGFGGGDGISDGEYLTETREAANGTFYTVAAPDASLSSTRQFVTLYQAHYHEPVGAYSASAYAAAKVLIAAIETALASNGGTMPTRDQVRSLVANEQMDTPVGHVAFEKNGDLVDGIISGYQIKNGKPAFIGSLKENERSSFEQSTSAKTGRPTVQ